MSSWNIIVCGDFTAPIAISVPDPSKWHVTDLKQAISEKTEVTIALTDITLYLGTTKLPEDKPLQECIGMRNGIALLVSTYIKPFVINVYCPDIDVTLTIEIPKREFSFWTIKTICEAICFKEPRSEKYAQYLLVYNGNTLTNSRTGVSTIPGITDNCLMTYTKLESFWFNIPNSVEKTSVLLPCSTDASFASLECFYGRSLSTSSRRGYDWLSGCSWIITVQTLDGLSKTKIAIDVNRHCPMPIRSLREAIDKKLSVPTYQQRLLLGNTVLEDLRKDYQDATITDYPGFHCGITLHLVQLTDGIRVNISQSSDRTCSFDIHIPSVFTLKNVFQYMKAQAIYSKDKLEYENIYLEGTDKYFSSSDDPVSSIEWITNDCNLTLKALKV